MVNGLILLVEAVQLLSVLLLELLAVIILGIVVQANIQLAQRVMKLWILVIIILRWYIIDLSVVVTVNGGELLTVMRLGVVVLLAPLLKLLI